jgi:hypothetical protein
MPPVEERLSGLEVRMEDHTRRFTEIGEILRQIDRKIDNIRTEMVAQFRWTIGIMLTMAAGILTAVLTH